MTSGSDQHVETARGILLLGVFHIHALYALLEHMGDADMAGLAWLQVKVLAPHVVLYFALSGMTSKALADKRLALVAARSQMLMLVAIFSHVIGELLQLALWKPWDSAQDALTDMALPIALGTGHSNYVAWFFVVLAVVRLLAFWLTSNVRAFAILIGVAAAAVAASVALDLPDNLYEWRNWPAALLMFMLGTRIAQGWRVPHWAGLPAILVGLALPLFNRPMLWTEGPCLNCDPQFVAQPMVGSYGFMPLYLVQELLAVLGLLWLARMAASTAIGSALAWVGRRSIQLLVLHGWVIVSVYAVAAFIAPLLTSAWMFLAVFAGNVLLHVMLYKLLERLLSRFLLACSRASRKLVAMTGAIGRAATAPSP
jgi:hypothetical protein